MTEIEDQKVNQQLWEKWLRESVEYVRTSGENRLNQMLKPEFESCNYEDQTVRIRFELEDWEMNPRGELHGGSIASMFDVALGLTARCASQSGQVATTDISVSYLRRVEADDTIFIQTKVQKSGRLMTRVTAEATSGKHGKVVATAQSSFMVLL